MNRSTPPPNGSSPPRPSLVPSQRTPATASSSPERSLRSAQRPLRVGLIDMNAGHPNQAMRCFRQLVSSFFDRVQKQNPGLDCTLVEVSPRDTGSPIPRDCDIYLGTGGPGSPFDGDHEAWFADWNDFCAMVLRDSRRDDADQKSLFGVCYTFELMVRSYGVAAVTMRDSRKFGVMPIYTTPSGQEHPLLSPFRDRLFAFEHRNWEAVDLRTERLAELGGSLLAQESRDGYSKGRALLGIDFGRGIEAVQFHPEADRAGVMSWVARPEQAAAFRATYGEMTYQAMLRTLDDPSRLASTYALVIPGFLARRFNALAAARGLAPIEPPDRSDVMRAFEAEPSPSQAPPPLEAPSKRSSVNL